MLILIGVLVGGLGWIWSTPPRYVRMFAIILIVIAAFFEYRNQENEYALSAQTGLLRSKEATAEDSDFPKIEIGNSGTVFVLAGDPSLPFLRILKDCELMISRVGGELKVSTTIRDQSGAVVAEIHDNEWQINTGSSYDRNYSETALEVLDSSGRVALQVVALSDRVQLQGIWYDANGDGVALWSAPLEIGGAFIEMTGLQKKRLEAPIERMFRYPSARHLGELRSYCDQLTD